MNTEINQPESYQSPPKSAETVESWLFSDNFLKRAFAIWGHFMVAHMIIVAGTVLIFLLLMLIIAIIFGGLLSSEIFS